MKKENIIIFLYRESVGELNVALPIIKRIEKNIECKKIYFYVNSKEKLKKIDSTYKNIIQETGDVIVGIVSFLKLLLSLKDKNITILSTDKCPEFELKQLREFFPSSTTILMHHAQSILYKHQDEPVLKKKKSIYEVYKPDFFLVGNKIDYENEYFTRNNYNIPKEKIVLIGALNYEKEWLKYLIKKDNSNTQAILEKKAKYKKTILVTTRAIHKEYMMEEDYNYQVESILKLAKKFQEYLFIIKPHPREKLKIYKKAFENDKSNNLIISNLNAYKLCSYSDLVISFWSSVIQDCVITNKPVIEFHRHSIKNSKLLIFDKGKLKSFFKYYGFCSFCDNYEDLSNYLEKDINEELIKMQMKNIKNIFMPNEEIINKTLESIKELTKREKEEKEINSLKITLKYVKNVILAYVKKKIK